MTTNLGYLISLSGGGGTQDLSSVLGFGDATGGNNIVVSSSDSIRGEDNPLGSGYNLNLVGGAPGGAGAADGGDIILTPGTGINGGDDGEVLINGDLTITGDLNYANWLAGAGNPEGVVGNEAPIGAMYARSDGGAGNSLYLKQANAGGNTGWVPVGPAVIDKFTTTGSSVFMTSKAVFTDPLTLGVSNLRVFWNGVLQRVGGSFDFTFTAPSTITFNTSVPSGDEVAIEYLPA